MYIYVCMPTADSLKEPLELRNSVRMLACRVPENAPVTRVWPFVRLLPAAGVQIDGARQMSMNLSSKTILRLQMPRIPL